jgi:hypothetical protein
MYRERLKVCSLQLAGGSRGSWMLTVLDAGELEKDFVVAALDVLCVLVEAVGPSVEALVARSSLREVIPATQQKGRIRNVRGLARTRTACT